MRPLISVDDHCCPVRPSKINTALHLMWLEMEAGGSVQWCLPTKLEVLGLTFNISHMDSAAVSVKAFPVKYSKCWGTVQ